MNDNNIYIVQCTRDNIDPRSYCIKTFSLDSTMKRRLDEIGASFWEEPAHTITKSAVGKGL
jgi:hypothetical protein